MRKHIFTLLAGVLCASMVWAADKPVTPADGIPNYYATANGKSGQDLWTAISSITNKGFSSIGYDYLYDAYEKTDVYPEDSIDKAGKLWDMYAECTSFPKKCGEYKKPCDCYNREHSIPQSWWGGGTGGIGNDIFHVVPTDGKINGVRNNFEYGMVGTVKDGDYNDYNDNKLGTATSWSTTAKTIASNAGESVQGSGTVFQPNPQYRGDLARGILGTIVKWQSDVTTSNNFFSDAYDAAHYYGLTKKAVILLMKWHREDPVSQKEIDRNNGIQKTQGNRNPFIDYPYLVEYIWGEHFGETVDMSMLIASCDAAFVPGSSNGWKGGSTPVDPPTPVVIIKYGVTWSANGEEIRTDSIQEDKKPDSMPDEPVSCSTESDVFMGWTDTPIAGSMDDAPAVLYKALADIPAVTEDMTLYAVFAKQTVSENASPATYTFTGTEEGWTSTAYKPAESSNYYLLDNGKSLISPEIDLAGLSEIKATIRTYGSVSQDGGKNLDIHAGETFITSLTANNKTLTEYTWTKSTEMLSGKSTLTFTAHNAGSKVGIGFNSVTINATGAGVTYSRYITSCSSATEVNLLPTEQPARKILIGGHIYIQIDNQLFNSLGQRVK